MMICLAFLIPSFVWVSSEEELISHLLVVDGNSYEIPYSVNADVIAMAVDTELDSLLVGLENTHDSIMILDLPHDIIRAEENKFAVLVNGVETEYKLLPGPDGSMIEFFVPAFTEEVEIIGTFVIPEFPLGVMMISIILLITTISLSRYRYGLFRL